MSEQTETKWYEPLQIGKWAAQAIELLPQMTELVPLTSRQADGTFSERQWRAMADLLNVQAGEIDVDIMRMIGNEIMRSELRDHFER